jgi:hypothetical protein
VSEASVGSDHTLARPMDGAVEVVAGGSILQDSTPL